MNEEVVGHRAQRRYLQQLLERGRLPSTMLFNGPAGVGKYLVARELAYALLCENGEYGGCEHCKSCALLAANNHPDLHLIEVANSSESSVASLRALLTVLQLRSFYGGARVVILRDADQLTSQAANLLLKSLEEPGARTYFLLTATNSTQLPATVLSRCQAWFFEGLSAEEIASVICRREMVLPAELSLEDAVVLADGSLENLDGLAAFVDAWKLLGISLDRVHAGDPLAIPVICKLLSSHKEQTSQILALIRILARQRMLHSLKTGAPSTRWAILLQNAIIAERLISTRNLNTQYVAHCLLSALLPHCAPQIDTIPRSHITLDQYVV